MEAKKKSNQKEISTIDIDKANSTMHKGIAFLTTTNKRSDTIVNIEEKVLSITQIKNQELFVNNERS